MKNSSHKILSTILLLFFTTLVFNSCEKEKNTIPGTDPIDNLRKTGVTDATGKASFTYKHEAILDVSVNKNLGNHTYSGSGVIRLLRGKTEQITVEAVKQ